MRRPKIFFILFFLAFYLQLSAQSSYQEYKTWRLENQGIRCATDEYTNYLKATDPSYQEAIDAINAQNQNQNKVNSTSSSGTSSNSIPCNAANTIVVPVAVHYSGEFTCDNVQCLVDAALNNIATMNEDFSATNADIANYTTWNAACPAAFPLADLHDGTCISFCLATENHPVASGLTNGQPAITIDQFTWGGGGAPQWAGYFNIFVEPNTGLLGIANAPGQANGDGVLVDAVSFGGTGVGCTSGEPLNSNGTYDLGRTLTHEVGHYFDLYHVFQGGCGNGDTGTFSGNPGSSDTPAQDSPFFGCPTVNNCGDVPASGCGGGYGNFPNFMDYTDDACMIMFTQDQAAVMNFWANSLPFVDNATVCGGAPTTSLIDCSLTANFTPTDGTDVTVCLDDGGLLELTDLSSNGPTSWTWDIVQTAGNLVFSPTGAGSSTDQNPILTFTGGTMGTLQVTLTVCDPTGTCDDITQTFDVTLATGTDCPDECAITLNMMDTFGDGWNGGSVEITVGGVTYGPYDNLPNGSDGTETIMLEDGAAVTVTWNGGGFDNEVTYEFVNPDGDVLFSDGTNPSGGTFTVDCGCPGPIPCDTDVCTNGGSFIWNGPACDCVLDEPTVNGCTDPTFPNFDAAANCDDGTYCCTTPDGCTDVLACNFDPAATCNDGNCIYQVACDTDPCTNGGTYVWDAVSCDCILDVATIAGCTIPAACNFDATANCSDNTLCFFGEPTCADPCNPIYGCTDPAACNWDITACADDGSCIMPPCLPGCTDPCAPNYDPLAGTDDGSCLTYDTTCDVDPCTNGGTYIWDPATCACEIDEPTVTGCDDPTACNFDVNVNCPDNSLCDYGIGTCTDPCSLNTGCTDAAADNYDASADCDDGSCTYPCPDPGNCDDGDCLNGEEVWSNSLCACESINVPVPCTDDGDCSNGVEVWDDATCTCTAEDAILGCTDPNAANFVPSANCDSGDCSFDFGNVVFLPNAFTPNGDRSNDFFETAYAGPVQTVLIQIYNRWGNRVFQSTDPFFKWDGNTNGKEADSGVYVYTIEIVYQNGQKESRKGNVTLVR